MRQAARVCSWLLVALACTAAANASTITLYDARPSPLPGNLPSEGFECCQVNELGQGVNLLTGGTFDNLTLIVDMSNWALESSYEAVGTSTGFSLPITASLYNLNPDGTIASVLDTVTQTQSIAWRPESDPSCGGRWKDAAGNCWSGSLSTISFNFGTVALPGQIAFGIAYNTFSGGYSPTGVHSPADSLNVALNTAAPSVGSNLASDAAYVAYHSSQYGSTTFAPDNGWSSYTASAALVGDTANPVPEPGTMTLLGLGLAAVTARVRRRNKGTSIQD